MLATSGVWPFLCLALSTLTVAETESYGYGSGCQQLKAKYGSQTSFPDSQEYKANIGENWSESCVEQSTCLFEPTSAEDVAGAVKILKSSNTKFAVRGGGHMPVPGASSIKDGVLISTEKLNTKELSADKKIAKLGPGLRWGDVYDWISPNGVAVLGGRYGPVGVPGLLLGGGINFFGSKYGWSASLVKNFQVVLASGKIVDANAVSNPDLFWALKGGSSNFGIVTRFDLTTFPVDKIYGGTAIYKPEAIDAYLDAIASFAPAGGESDDVETSVNPTLQLNVSDGTFSINAITCHNGNDANPKSLSKFSKIPRISTTESLRPNFAAFTDETTAAVYGDRSKRWLFASTSLKATKESVYLTNGTFTDVLKSTPELKDVRGLLVASTQQTITKAWLQNARKNGGDAIDLDPENGNFIAYLINATWEDEKDDDKVNKWALKVLKTLDDAAKLKKLDYPFRYLNDAQGTEDIFSLYGAGKSAPKLKQIAKKYDPDGVFQRLMPGGFKLFK